MSNGRKGRTKARPRSEQEESIVASEAGAPTEVPPSIEEQGGAAAGVGLTEPTRTVEEGAAADAGMMAGAGTGPTEVPPAVQRGGAVAVEEAAAVAATWRSGVTVTALWSINEVRNAWMHVANVGWRKLFNGRDGAFTALVTLASQARQTGRQIAFREEADGMVYEIYLW